MTEDFLYHMPAEWEPHEATWLSWPHRRDTWPERLKRSLRLCADCEAPG